MKTTIEAFRDFYESLGGTASDVENITTIPDMIDALNDVTGLGNLSNVAIASPSNGQVLTYDGTSEKWKNADAAGGGSSGGAVYIAYASTLDQSFNDIKDLVDAGNVVCVVKSDGTTDGYYYLSQLADVISLAGYAIVTFYGSDPETGTMGTISFTGTTLDAPLSTGS